MLAASFCLRSFGVEAREEDERRARVVVDRLGVDVLRAELDAQAGARGGAGDLLADPPAALLQELAL
jgi:hypothetical protein